MAGVDAATDGGQLKSPPAHHVHRAHELRGAKRDQPCRTTIEKKKSVAKERVDSAPQ